MNQEAPPPKYQDGKSNNACLIPPREKVLPNWDKFKDIHDKGDSISMADTSFVDASFQIIKLLAYAITFTLVLGGAVFAKSTLLLMTSQLSPNRIISVKMGNLNLSLQLPPVEKYLWIWSLIFCFSVPEFGAFIRSVRIAIFKGYSGEEDPQEEITKKNSVAYKYVILVTILMETLHVIGLSIFVFGILPYMDVVKGAMLTNCVCVIPGFLSVLSHNCKDVHNKFLLAGNILALFFQITGLLTWPILFRTYSPHLWLTPISLILMSCKWWKNYVSEESPIGLIKFLARIKGILKEKTVLLYKIYIGISLWKIVLFLCISISILQVQGMDAVDFFQRTIEAFGDRTMVANEVDIVEQSRVNNTFPVPSIGPKIRWIVGAQILSAYICYVFGKFACRVMIQPFSFALPSALVVPATIIFVIVTTSYRNENPFIFCAILPNYVFFNAPQIYDVQKFFIGELGLVWILWVVSQVWITFHIWLPRCERLSKTEKLFATPMYSAFLVDQSIALNRRRDEFETVGKKSGVPPHIIACATMWHETRPEMLEMLKSLLRLDNDQCLKLSAKKCVNDPEAEANFYTYEAHIFFDDAFEIESEESTRTVINGFVRDFLKIVKKATKNVYRTEDIWIKPPLKYSTPYGGRLEYTMPGENKLYVHLKDKDKIRHKKRWSQVMYMYYLLGYKLMELPISYEQKMEKAENTFLLALDGDIDFKPDAVLLLVDLMKKNKSLGAACGRIHPVGSGFMVWYQLFEYAIGHWLQKATEHMIGCVLCSPGCFSLFRGKALMSSNVIKRYTTKAEEARHYVQYDQGEDRWLCTLLLQRGYRVEYSAASDAYTHCPETFSEFYTQRRRWIPSTLANIVDLLNNYKHTVRINNDISLLYIGYQMLLLVGTILGPGTILLMLVGAFNAAFHMDNWTALYVNLIPICGFILCCLFTKSQFQISVALVISLVYGLIMMAVLVGVVMEIKDDGFLSPSSLFLFTTVAEIVIAGIIHPQEILCLMSGVIYYVTIPSMYLLLIIYSVCNLNVVSWGTREVARKKTKADLENEKKAEKVKLFGLLDNFYGKQEKEVSGAVEFSLSNIFKCMCCTNDKTNTTTEQYIKIADTLNGLKKKVDDLDRNIYVQHNAEVMQMRKSLSLKSLGKEKGQQNVDSLSEDFSDKIARGSDSYGDDESRDELFNPYWIEDKDLRKSKFEVLSSQEITFWCQLIKNYLSPLVEDKEKQAEMTKNLRDLRDKMVVTFFMLNALFVVVVFLLQVNKGEIHIKWPLEARANITFDPVTYEINIQKTYLELEPVGLIFISFFASVLVIQFLAMLLHRFETLCHLLSNTPLTILKKKKTMTFREKLENARKQFNIQNARMSGNLRDDMEEQILVDEEKGVDKRKSRAIHPDELFNSIFQQMKEEEERETAEREEKRKSSVFPWRRSSIQKENATRRVTSVRKILSHL
ncbi:hypothetical protein RUM43_009319 [Polyplax serrata]|uniref:chitin synthase n=1 Tax=Polyplax serrata TaxID=468196 RepID=A0AAN8PCQ1_POLSC